MLILCRNNTLELLIRIVIPLYTEACTVVPTYTGPRERLEVKVGLPQWAVLNPLLFAIVMDVVSSELVYANDYVV